MSAEARTVAGVLLLIFVASSSVLGQDTARCYYMTTAIPREPKPDDFVEISWSGGWSDFPIIPAEPRDDVCIEEYYPGSSTGNIIIHMEEEIVGDVYIGKLNYQGSQTPEIVVPILAGQFDLLGPELRHEDGEWFIVITQRQDYETPIMQRYTFDIRVADQTLTARVTLSVENIDDNDPIVRILDACSIPELGEARLTDCVYEVYDADGQLSILPMTFRIDSDRNDDQTFYIHEEFISGDQYNMRITLGLNAALDFETNPLHIFQITAMDSIPNTHTVTVMVQVQNVEHRPPRWMEIFAVQQFDEKTNQSFTVRAIDGDTGIDKPIYYRIEAEDDFFSIETIEGGRSGAIFQVSPIDRDTLERELFTLSIIAYKFDNESFATEAPIAIIVNDINDQYPKPLHEEYFVKIMEETPLTLEFDEEFGFHDRDLGVHAQYEVRIESEYPPGAEAAFYIAPEVGYQRQTFIMGTLNHSMLDYEDPPFQHITLRVIATDLDNSSHVGVALVYIDLINWNDEEPIFEFTNLEVAFDETVGEGYPVTVVKANDRDIGDRVEHSLLGNALDYLRIDQDTGEIFVSVDNAFDYHRQNQLFVQVRAVDTLMEPYHTATSTLVINLNDINNTPPTLRLPRGSPSVEENVPEDFIIQVEDGDIVATDPDTTADLLFEIDWSTSYATKQGRETNPVEYHNCVDIQTIFLDPARRGSAIGRVVVKEIRPNVTIDFEEFEVMYLTVRVRDLNTVDGDDFDESTFTIIIIDMNDNWPMWSEGSLTQEFRVRERSASGVVIGSVLATDIDGPLYNQVRYTIVPSEDTPENLVKIDFYTGQITVDVNQAIDADLPKRWFLNYTVIASDRCYLENRDECPDDPTYWDTPGEITIQIIDTNNRNPVPDYTGFNTTLYIYENALQGTEVVWLVSTDDDRDEIYHTVRYQINYAVNSRLQDFFSVDLDTGLVYVDYSNSNNNDVLDRDGDEPTHRIFLTIIDNFYSEGDGNRNQDTTEVLVILLDENDNAPELPSPEQWNGQWNFAENLEAGVLLSPNITAPDRDEPNTPNSHVGYAIFDLSIQETSRPYFDVPRLFNMVSLQNESGKLETAMDLKGYWGTYDIHILAFDHGIPQQISEEIYELIIRPYNFHEPVFVFPSDGTVVRIWRERATVNGVLTLVNGEFLDRISATDEDGLHAGTVTFQIVGNAEAVQYFNIENDGENLGTLLLAQAFSEDVREFDVTIRATDGGIEPDGGPLYTETTLKLIFVPTQGDPIFNDDSTTVSFVELDEGLTQSYQLPLAVDPKNYACVDDDCRNIYYRILDGNDAGHFALDSERNVITVVKELNRTENEVHILSIAASNDIENPGLPQAASILRVTVNVREANPRPIFERDLYTAGISTLDSINRELLSVRATHSDGAAITYEIDYTTMVVDPTLEAVANSAFLLNSATGVLTLQIQPTSAMHGLFIFQIVATDPAGETDRTEIRIYLISSRNRVTFIFRNIVSEVENDRDFIQQTFGFAFGMICNIDQVLQATDNSGLPLEDRTEVRSHFILDDMPVEAESIEEIRGDIQLISSIQNTLSTRLLVLDDFVTDISPDVSTDTIRLLVYALAGLSAVLALLCLILILAYLLKTRALNKRLEALSMTKYGSVDSGLNRVGLIAAPGTNKHAVEGSNPIWNEKIKAPDFDAISDASGDSDLIGIENLPQFRTDYYPSEDASSTQEILPDGRNRPVFPIGSQGVIATHCNDFGFNTSPFSPEFANRQFRR